MALPVGVSTCLVTFGKAVSYLGAEAVINGRLTVDRPVVHAATGTRVISGNDALVTETGTLAFYVPHVDQSGFVDAASQGPTTHWTYVLNATITVGGVTENVRKVFQPLVGQSEIDLDLVAEGPVTPGVTAPQAVVTSVAGETGAVSAESLAEALGGLVGGSGLPSNVVSRTTAYTAAANDFVLATTTSAGFTVTLPTAPATGALVAVKKVSADGNTLTITPASGGTIDGDPTATTVTKGGGAVFEHVGSNAWQIVAVTLTTGPAGPAGATGPAGPAGPTGPTGPSGGGGLPFSGSVVGAYYMPQIGSGASIGGSQTALNEMQLVPIWLEAGTLDRIAQQVLSGTASGETMRLGLYADNGRGFPGALVVDGGSINLGTSGIRAMTISTAVNRALYWTALVRQGAGTTVGLLGFTEVGNSAPGPLGMAMLSGGSNLFDSPRSLVQTGVTGALPATAAPTGSSQAFHPAYLRYGA